MAKQHGFTDPQNAVIFEKLGSSRIIFHNHCNYTGSTRELHKRDFFLIAELPEAFLPAREKTRSQNGNVDKGSKWTKVRFFFSKMYVAK